MPETANYIFSIHSNDGVRLWINQQLVIDEFTIVESELSGHRLVSQPISLTKDIFLPFKLQYFESTDVAFITLLWRTTLPGEVD